MATIDTVKVAGLTGRIEEELENVGPVPSLDDYPAWKAHQQAYRAIIDALVADEGAVYRPRQGDACGLRLAGISTSCTAGDQGLLRNWVNAASRRLAAEKAGA